VELLRTRATDDPELRFLTFLERGEQESDALSAAQTETRARAVAARLRQVVAPGERALLFFGPGLEFTLGYWGCLLAGVIAVPVPSPGVRAIESGPRLRGVVDSCGATAVLTTADLVPHLGDMGERDGVLGRLHVIAVDEVPEGLAAEWTDPGVGPSTVAHLQYSSGSTGEPKGVVLTHENILSNLDLIWGEAVDRSMSSPYGDRGVTWLPMFHDMGLVLGAFLPVFAGRPSWFMSPMAFLQRPVRWLQAISTLSATLTCAPNFALDLAVERIDEEQRRMLDLSSLRALCVGSEPIRRDSLRRFAEAFAVSGFDPATFVPSYGLAEATLMVTGGPVGSGVTEFRADAAALAQSRAVAAAEDDERALTLVACGELSPGVRVLVVDPETLEILEDGHVGEILAEGPGIGQGYWNNAEATQSTFAVRVPGRAEPFMRTGDLGFLHDGQLYVTGRIKELVIVHGQNHYPHDLELTACESHPALRTERCIAFSVDDGASERLVIVAAVTRRDLRQAGPSEGEARSAIEDAVRQAVASRHGLPVDEVVLARRVPLTSSGKLRRAACRDLYLSGELDGRRTAGLEASAS
jgi:acyl-CoA synthetase (AMP-forming)/AMP-acid ligase II